MLTKRVTSAKGDFNNQVDRRTYSVDNSFSPRSPLLSLNGLMNKVAMAARMEVKPELSNMDFHSLRLTWMGSLLSTRTETNTEPPIQHHYQG